MTNLQKLTKIIQEANPELMELSFGCEVTFEGSVGMPHINHSATVLKTNASGTIEIYTGFPPKSVNKEELEILGHPITLEHVLVALKAKSKAEYSNRPTIELKDYKHAYTELLCFWQLTKPLSGQSEETINFLLEILEKE